MEDLVKRLRVAGQHPGGDLTIIIREAADEIEELREALKLTAKTLRRAIEEIQSELP